MEFKNLEYIAFEGGGGKGAVYKGAIIALEKLFDKSWKDEVVSKMVNGNISNPPQSNMMIPDAALNSNEFSASSIMDYYEKGKKTAKIKGISGASAGSITAFPLSLGLTSDDIDTILKLYPFNEEFLPNKDLQEGKYRMVGMNIMQHPKILVAEDHLKKLGNDHIEPYLFSGKRKINSNKIKQWVRAKIVNSLFKVILGGIRDFFEQLRDFFDKYKNLKIPYFSNSQLEKIIKDVLSFLSIVLKSTIDVSQDSLVKKIAAGLFKVITPQKIAGLIPNDNITNAFGNIIWDRGIYAGFEVREFFFKILLMALSKDTHFKRKCLEEIYVFENIKLTEEDLKKFKYTFNDAFDDAKYEKQQGTFGKLYQLPEMLSFKLLKEITGVDLSICVTNGTTNQPIYFSHYFTPDFPVMEALGASMSFPLAFKPVYNEANVLKSLIEYTPFIQGFKENEFTKPKDLFQLKLKGQPGIYSEVFSMRNYNKYLSVVLRYIKEIMGSKMSVNSNLSFRSFLPYLRIIIENGKTKPFEEFERISPSDMEFLCYFYYNSAFKGLFIDGGVTNNLPISIFTFKTNAPAASEKKQDKTTVLTDIQDLMVKEKTLSVKLDNSFPPDIRKVAFDILDHDKDGKTLDRLSNWQDKLAHLSFANKIFNDLKLRKSFDRGVTDKKSKDQIDFLSELSKEAWVKVSKELVKEYKLTKGGFTPWNKEVNIVSSLMSSLQFGFDQGQIENVSDNENIIPLYCFGVDTLDFDLKAKDMAPLVKVAVQASEKQVSEYFSGEKNDEKE